MNVKFGRMACLSVLLIWAPWLQAQTEECWVQHRATVYEWTCAAQSLPPESRDYALSIVVVDSPKALMVIDSGATATVGQSAAEAIRGKFGTKPVWIVNTQPKPEHVLGNTGFRAAFASTLKPGELFNSRVVGGKKTAEVMQVDCARCVEEFADRAGSNSLRNQETLVPGRILRIVSGHLGLLHSDWVSWKFRLYANLETEEALVLRNQDLKLWWVGSAVQNRDVPDLYHGDVIERINFLARLKSRMGAGDTLLTSFGALDRDWIERNLNYFVRIQQEVLYRLEEGIDEVQLIEQISARIGEFKHPVYVQTDARANAKALETHQLNIQRIARQTESIAF